MQASHKRGTVALLRLRQRFQGGHVLFGQVRFALPEVAEGLGHQEAKRRPANLGAKGITLLREFKEAEGFVQRAPFLRRLHQVKERPAILRQSLAPECAHPLGGFRVVFLHGPLQPLLEGFRMGIKGTCSLEEFLRK